MSELESLSDLIRLYRRGSSEYSSEYLAAAICREIGRQRRLRAADRTEALDRDLEAAERLLSEGSTLPERAVAATLGPSVLEDFREYVRGRTPGDDEDEGFRLLYTYDSLRLLTSAVRSRAGALSRSGRAKLKELESALRAIEKAVDANLPAFQPNAIAANGYCLRWEVEDESPLSRVAELSPAERERLLGHRSRLPATLPAEGPDCLPLDVVAAIAEGASPRRDWAAHLRSCLRCAQILNDTINVSLRAPIPLGERVARLSKRAPEVMVILRGETLRGASAVSQALREWSERLAPRHPVPSALTASSKRSRRTTWVSVVNARGEVVGRFRSAVVAGPAIEKGAFRFELLLPSPPKRGARVWVGLKLGPEEFYLARARPRGERVMVKAKGFPRVTARLPLSRIEVVILEPDGR